ncbi:MAG: type IV pilus assembly protein PilB [Microgenomates group bacterium Gr01-1014_80]|nr:MAG: type IV pilus assembly protein PilB [Microgenomates group bacterium Gr01-1014_80]
MDETRLFQLVADAGVVPEADLKKAQELSTQRKIPLYEVLVEKDLIADENLGKLVSDALEVPFANLQKIAIPLNLLHIIPESVAEKQLTIVFGEDKDKLKIATNNPGNNEFLEFVSKKAGKKLEVYFATLRDIKKSLNLYKKELYKTFDDLLKQQVNAAGKGQSEAPIAKIVDTLIEYAYRSNASDIHIEPEEEHSLVRFRIDGILHDELKLPKELHDQVITRIKVLSSLRTDEHLSAQDGKLQMKLKEEDLDVRVSLVPIVGGEKAVLRLLTSHYRQFGLSDLGMNTDAFNKVKGAIQKPYGMILSTGPTGSGKTTSIYAILKILNVREKNIATIEDPVEYEIEGINQIQVNPKTNLTFAEGLRSILRQDPDIIYVGEIRDEETASIAINSAMTGHLVVSTLHTNDSATALPRLIDMKIEPFLVASTVNVIVAQRLVRKICDRCKFSYQQTAVELKKQISGDLIKKHLGSEGEIRLYQGKGCDVCHMTGYVGRIGIFEVLEVSEAIKDLIVAKAQSDAVTKKAVGEGMLTMLEDGLQKVQLGVTTIEEVLRATSE